MRTHRWTGLGAWLVLLALLPRYVTAQEFGHSPDGTLLPGCKLLRDDQIPIPVRFSNLTMTEVGPVADSIQAEARRRQVAVAIPDGVPIAPVDTAAAMAGISVDTLKLDGAALAFRSKALRDSGFVVSWGDDDSSLTLYVRWNAVGQRLMRGNGRELLKSVVCREPPTDIGPSNRPSSAASGPGSFVVLPREAGRTRLRWTEHKRSERP